MPERQTRSDCTLKTLAKKLKVSEEVFRHENGRKIRNDKTVGAMRRENAEDQRS